MLTGKLHKLRSDVEGAPYRRILQYKVCVKHDVGRGNDSTIAGVDIDLYWASEKLACSQGDHTGIIGFIPWINQPVLAVAALNDHYKMVGPGCRHANHERNLVTQKAVGGDRGIPHMNEIERSRAERRRSNSAETHSQSLCLGIRRNPAR